MRAAAAAADGRSLLHLSRRRLRLSWSALVRAGASQAFADMPAAPMAASKRFCARVARRTRLVALASCAVGPDYRPPEAPMPANLCRGISPARDHPRVGGRTAKWWRTLHDRELDSLIDRAIAASPTLEIALNRIQQARAQEAVVIGTALPSVGGSDGGGCRHRQRSWPAAALRKRWSPPRTASAARRVSNIAGFDAAWEIDIFGKYRRAIEAAQYDVDAAIAAATWC